MPDNDLSSDDDNGTLAPGPEPRAGDAEAAVAPKNDKDPYEVGWEGGDSDPLNPRSFKILRKWVIVFVVCFCSFCV